MDISELEVFAGLGFTYQKFAQTSAVLPDTGNLTGSRFSFLSPFVRMHYDKDILGELTFDWNGTYSFSRPTVDGASLSYGHPIGVELLGAYRAGEFIGVPRLFLGVRAGYLSFSQESQSDFGSRPQSLSLFQLGGVLLYEF
jgi:hypothetical protein